MNASDFEGTGGRRAVGEALRILHQAEISGAYVNLLLNSAETRPGFDPKRMGLVRQLVKGVTQWRGAIDAILSPLLRKGQTLNDLDPWVRTLLRLGAYQLRYTAGLPPPVAVNEIVEVAKRYTHKGGVSLINAVLRRLAREQPGDIAASESIAEKYSHPEWLVQRWIRRFGEEQTAQLCKINNTAWPLTIRVNTILSAPDAARKILESEGVELEPGRYLPEIFVVKKMPKGASLQRLKAYREGLIQVQDESAAVIAHLVDPAGAGVVYDLCSAPGGKTTHLAALMKGAGKIVAFDKSPARLDLVRQNCRRLRIDSVQFVVADASVPPLCGLADRLLLDAPCSGLGNLGRKSDLRWQKSEDDIERLSVLQLNLIKSAARFVKPGGRLIYSTCTMEPEENEEVVRKFLAASPGYQQLRVSALPAELIDSEGFYRTFPHLHGIGGSFAAVIERVSISSHPAR